MVQGAKLKSEDWRRFIRNIGRKVAPVREFAVAVVWVAAPADTVYLSLRSCDSVKRWCNATEADISTRCGSPSSRES